MTNADYGQTVEVEMDLDKKRFLKIDFNTLCRAEEVTGQTFLDMEAEVTGVRLRALVWAGLQYDEGEIQLTLDEVGLLVGAYYVQVMTAFIEAWQLAMPDPDPEAQAMDDTENPLETATAPS